MFNFDVLGVAAQSALALKEEDGGVDVDGARSAVRFALDVAEREVEDGSFGEVNHAFIAVVEFGLQLRGGVNVAFQRVPGDVELGGDGAEWREPAEFVDYRLVVGWREDFRRAVGSLASAHLRVALARLSARLLARGFWFFFGRHFSFLHSVLQRLALRSG